MRLIGAALLFAGVAGVVLLAARAVAGGQDDGRRGGDFSGGGGDFGGSGIDFG